MRRKHENFLSASGSTVQCGLERREAERSRYGKGQKSATVKKQCTKKDNAWVAVGIAHSLIPNELALKWEFGVPLARMMT